MCSAATYYFNSDIDDEGTAELLLSLKFTYVYQAGTVAFGGFIISLLSVIQYMFTLWAKKAVRLDQSN